MTFTGVKKDSHTEINMFISLSAFVGLFIPISISFMAPFINGGFRGRKASEACL